MIVQMDNMRIIIILFVKYVIQTAKPVIPLPATASAVTWKLVLSFFSQEISASRTVQSVSTNKHPTTLVLPAQMAAKPAQDRP